LPIAVVAVIVTTEPAVAEAVIVAKVARVAGIRLKAASVEATLVEAAAELAAAEAAATEAASVEAAAASSTGAATTTATSARISADRGERQSPNHEKSRECSLDRWSHVCLSMS
jgi:hypothetical protein